MKKRLSSVLCLALIICLLPMSSALAKKNVKSKSVSVAPKSMTLAVGDIAQLNATMKPSNSTDKLTWTTSDKSVATVTSKGVVKGVSEGNATITVKTSSKKTATCSVAVKKYVTADEITDSVAEGLKEKFATKDSVLELVKQNTYTKGEIDAKVAEIPTGGSCGCASDFTDGSRLEQLSGQTLPITIASAPRKIQPSVEITINSITVKKYHYDQFYDYSYSPLKYDIEIKGVVPQTPSGTCDSFIVLGFLDKNKGGNETRYYSLRNVEGDDDNVKQTYSERNGEFTLSIEQYKMAADYSYFYVYYFDYEVDDE